MTTRRRRPVAFYSRWQLLCRNCQMLGRTLPERVKRAEALAAAQEHANKTGHEVIVTHRREWTIRRKERDATLRDA
jgi:hypothetical protein